MPQKFRGKFRTDSVRLTGYDYSRPAMYYVTICTRRKRAYFGDLIQNKNDLIYENLILNPVGMIAGGFWDELPDHFLNIELDEYVVMPDHLHGIIIIHKTTVTDDMVETLHATSLQVETPKLPIKMSIISPKTGSLSVIIRSYKSAVTKRARKINHQFAWQSGYYEHIIRNMNDFERIRKYIRNNPYAH